MTRNSIKEYVEAIRGRYQKVGKEEKGKVLDEFTKTTGLHRKAAMQAIDGKPRDALGLERVG